MKVVILAGGMGTRLSPRSEEKPKPMIEIGGRPILWHIMKYFAHYGLNEFVVALGYRGDAIKDYFLNYRAMNGDLTVSLGSGKVSFASSVREDWTVHLIDTGISTHTGGRLKRLSPHIGDETFIMTYGDGLADVDLDQLRAFHRSHGRLATVTAVHPPARFGQLTVDGEQAVTFREKPQISAGWINGGFFVLEPGVLDYIADDRTGWENEPMERLTRVGQLGVFRHEGFWQCIDTPRDLTYLEDLWQSPATPWVFREQSRFKVTSEPSMSVAVRGGT